MTVLPSPAVPSVAAAATEDGSETLVWYVSYGSNLHADRLRCYLAGGRPAGSRVTYLGARDPSPPRAVRPVWLPGGIYFAGESSVWGGGMAFYDPDLPGRAAGRAYLMTVGQFSDVVAQEMHRPVAGDLPVPDLGVGARAPLGPGCYETLVGCGTADRWPLVTFTAPWSATGCTWAAPSAAYLATILAGLVQAHPWTVAAAAGYLAGRPGAAGHWGAAAVAALAP